MGMDPKDNEQPCSSQQALQQQRRRQPPVKRGTDKYSPPSERLKAIRKARAKELEKIRLDKENKAKLREVDRWKMPEMKFHLENAPNFECTVPMKRKSIQKTLFGFPAFKGVKGSIVRIRIHDFMTYQKVELRAGANVNIILGPNGTGKSTIVCAICLGLAGKQKLLGRAVSLKEYIRRGAKASTLEIELFNPDGLNYVVKRVIKDLASGTSSDWSLNSKKVYNQEIDDLMEKLNIQLDNLCQFMPQDRVREFAEMSATTRLESTEKAVGNDSLYANHQQLKKIKEEIDRLGNRIKNDEKDIKNEVQMNKRDESDVDTYRQREKLIEKIDHIIGIKAWVIYLNDVDKFSKLKHENEQKLTEKIKLDKKIDPLKKLMSKLEPSLVKYRKDLGDTMSNMIQQSSNARLTAEAQIERIETKANKIFNELDIQEECENQRRAKVQALTSRLSALENEKTELVKRGDFDSAQVNKMIEEIKVKYQTSEQNILKIEEDDQSAIHEKSSVNSKMRLCEAELKRMTGTREQRLKFLERSKFSDTFKAHKLFFGPDSDNIKKRFKEEIWEPMILHVYVNDMAYGKYAESLIGFSDLVAFFCECKEDVNTMLNIVREKGLRISVFEHQLPEGFKKPTSAFPPQVMREHGFTKTMVDLIEAPDFYMSYIVINRKPQTVPIGSEKTKSKIDAILESNDPQLQQIRTFIVGNEFFRIKTSSYTTEKGLESSHVYNAKVFTDQINASTRDNYLDQIKMCKSQIAQIDAAIKSRKPELERLKIIRRDYELEIKELAEKKNRVKTINHKIYTVKGNIDSTNADAVDIQAEKEKARKKLRELKFEYINVLKKRNMEYLREAGRKLDVELLKVKVTQIQEEITKHQSTLDSHKSQKITIESKLKELQSTMKTLSEKAEMVKADAVRLSKSSTPPEEVKTADENQLDKDLNQHRIKLGFLVDHPKKILEDYETREQKIKDLTKVKEERKKELVDKRKQLIVIKDNWLSPLNKLVKEINQSFSLFFNMMGCAGEVVLSHSDDKEDFANYGIKIFVKFRASEPLSELSSWKQSGGERSITTALYILSLQALTSVPFRVIDEINQGMDKKNESRFFQLLCQLANGPETPQYFLLTPKMLPPVDYPANVDFHIIFNGPYVKVPFIEKPEMVAKTEEVELVYQTKDTFDPDELSSTGDELENDSLQ